MRLRPWHRQPDNCHALALCVRRLAELGRLHQVWLEWRGLPEILIAPFTHEYGPAEATELYAVALGQLPHRFLELWLREHPGWLVFYTVSAAREPARNGLFLPWGYETEGTSRTDGDAAILLKDGSRIPVPPPERFQNLLSLLPECRFAIPGSAASVSRDAPPGAEVPFRMPLALVPELDQGKGPSVEKRLRRIDEQMAKLRAQRETLLWGARLSEERPEVRLEVYPETEMKQHLSFWDLREWFAAAPEEELQPFEHARVVVEELGALHLVKPVSIGRPPTVLLPKARYTLRLDWRWQSKGRWVFVPQDWELWPYPPQTNQFVEDLMVRCLWDGEGATDPLVVLKPQGREPVRFTVSGFRPLAQQAQALNFLVPMPHLRRRESDVTRNATNEWLAHIRQQVEAHLANHVSEMTALLGRMWSGDRANLAEHERTVRELLDRVAEIRETQARIEGFWRERWDDWTTFRQEVLRHELDLLPKGCTRLRSQVQRVMELLDELSQLWAAEDLMAERRRLAGGLRQLADEVQQGSL